MEGLPDGRVRGHMTSYVIMIVFTFLVAEWITFRGHITSYFIMFEFVFFVTEKIRPDSSRLPPPPPPPS